MHEDGDDVEIHVFSCNMKGHRFVQGMMTAPDVEGVEPRGAVVVHQG